MSRRSIAKSANWRRAQEKDPQVRAARMQGWRSRAAFKLLEIDDKAKLFFANARVVDLGCAPGGWSQVAANKIGGGGMVAAVDILPMSAAAGVTFVRGDFLASATKRALAEILGGRADIILSDMSPNLSGIVDVDQARAAELARAAVTFALEFLSPGGKILIKGFYGGAFAEVRALFGREFNHARIFRPKATRQASREAYILATRLKKE